ncbi:hypothetical protein J3E72DRAFT_16772 [Bipolaris maydis]|nr:hypothetical protein J3E73DRAFT_434127 [Bipolaris maydis]KAJ5064589.1 hypothetical protein J3E74DRAFT_26272 [Bipolaris maydis]KAJ6193398.1 hypothetical protein J3E72DRAFT_16772 [Bipolaris maydis]KAJ6267981.1 hypothetical protein PSV08DRAFT_11442 [Bipolaris maydis]KAJ6277225.1 hypothetical protein J3E71DRAFT_17928 [Bipolaris maydis]
MAPPNTPLIYILWHLYLEPVFALGGVYRLHFNPESYFDFMPSTSGYSASSQIVCDQLASAYLFFAFTEGVLLRVVDDKRTWRWILFGLLLCDLGHCYAAWCEMGYKIFGPEGWGGKDGVTNSLNVLPVLIRTGYLLGIGVPEGETKKRA